MEEINLVELFRYYLRKLPIIIFVVIISIALGMVYIDDIQVPMYHGTTTIILVQKSDEKDNSYTYQNELNVNQRLVTTYSEIIKSRRVLDQVIDNLKYKKLNAEKLADKIEVVGVTDTSIIKVSVSDKDRKKAVMIANEVANVFKKEITNIYNLENVSIVDEAIIEDKPYNINVKKELLIFGLGGLLLSCGVIFVIFYFDNTIKSKADIEDNLGLAVLSEVPTAKKLSKKKNKKDDATFNNIYEGKVKKGKGAK